MKITYFTEELIAPESTEPWYPGNFFGTTHFLQQQETTLQLQLQVKFWQKEGKLYINSLTWTDTFGMQ